MIENYPEDKPFPSGLFYGIWQNQPLHAIISPVEYRRTVVVKVSNLAAKEAVDTVFNKLYPED